MARSPANKRSLGGGRWAGLGGLLLLLAVAVIALNDSAGPADRVAQNVGETASLRPLLANWGEGTSNADQQEGAGAASTPGDATWIHTFYNTAFWSTAGGDFSSAASAATTVGGTGQYSWSSAGMVADVQAWLDNPATNFGWIVMGN